MHRFSSIVLGLLLLTGAASACSDDSAGTTPAPSSTTAPDTTMAVETTVADTLPADTLPADSTPVEAPGDGSEFCAINDQLDAGAEVALGPDSTPADVQAFFEVLFPETFAEMQAAAPADLVDDMTILGAGFTSLGAVFADNEWNLATAFEDPAIGVLLDDPAYVAAGSAVDAFCGE